MNTLFEQNKPVMHIGAVADTLGIHQRTLRIYDKEGVLKPTRSPKKRRLYSLNDLSRLELILFMTGLGVSLSGVKIILDLLGQNDYPNPKKVIKEIAEKYGIISKKSNAGRKKNNA